MIPKHWINNQATAWNRLRTKLVDVSRRTDAPYDVVRSVAEKEFFKLTGGAKYLEECVLCDIIIESGNRAEVIIFDTVYGYID
jgi:hypothetical protein